MKMRRFLFNKLGRDTYIKNMEAKGAVLKTNKLEDNADYLEALTQKVVEELEEVFDSQSKDELLVELADLEEVLDTFKNLLEIKQEDINAVREAKRKERGTYDERLYIEYIDIPETATDDLEYLSALPDRYPEMDPETGKLLNEADEDDEEIDDEIAQNFLESLKSLGKDEEEEE